MSRKLYLKQSIILKGMNIDKYLVVGTMSSGKSTFLNSLIGFDLFPSKNEACTAKIISYYANPIREEFLYKNKNSKKPTLRKRLDSKQLVEWNENSKMDEIFIEGPLRSGIEESFGVIDTPGPNNSMDKTHREVMQRALSKNNYKRIFYILNATQLGTEDDWNLLNFIKGECEQSKLVFVVNKSDEIDDSELENLKLVSQSVKDYLREIGFGQPEIFFVSSLSALLSIKTINNYELTKKEAKDYKRLNILLEENLASYNINASVGNSSKSKIENELWNKSGIPELLNIF